MNVAERTVATVTLDELPVYEGVTPPAGGVIPPPPFGGLPPVTREVMERADMESAPTVDTDVERLRGMWREEPVPYLVDMRHPVVREEWDDRQLSRGRFPWEPEPERERRQFDREMVAKYGKIYPPPPRAKWVLATHGIIDQQEERARRKKEAAARAPVYEEVYIDEEI